jgi:putative DNA-invertase from lambdoid prophage Rac
MNFQFPEVDRSGVPQATPAAIFRRVSDIKQSGVGQDVLQGWADARGLDTRRVWAIQDSAWKPRSGKGKLFDATRAEMLEAARMGEFRVLIVWALDRLSRRGIRDTLTVLEQLHEYGVDVWSKEEPWLQVQGPMWEMQVAMFAWQAQQESQRKSERMTDNIAGRKASGKSVGRKPGSTDSGPRKRSGYLAAWEPGGARRVAQEKARGLARDHDESGRFQKAG